MHVGVSGDPAAPDDPRSAPRCTSQQPASQHSTAQRRQVPLTKSSQASHRIVDAVTVFCSGTCGPHFVNDVEIVLFAIALLTNPSIQERQLLYITCHSTPDARVNTFLSAEDDIQLAYLWIVLTPRLAMNEFARFSKRAVDYIFDRPPRNDDSSPIWCLGKSYESTYQPERPVTVTAGTSPSTKSESEASHADSGVVTRTTSHTAEQAEVPEDELVKSFDQVQLTKSMEEEDLGWPQEFLEDFESRIWLTYRNNFPPIAKSHDPAAASAMSFTTKLRNLANQGGFTSDTGWGCMIRSGQSLLANTLLLLRLGREWRRGQKEDEYKDLLSLFADTPESPFSIHRFVEHGAQACGTYPGEWFGPNATARCIR